ncbi:bifunctional DNA primase/polymerase, partial [Streptomyces sp. NPDC005921]
MAITDRQATTLALAHALSAAERGLAVIPLSRTKLPALRSPHRDAPGSSNNAAPHDHPEPTAPPCHGECGRPGHGVYDATSDPARIRELFAAAPWATGYGIACGLPPHRLIGVDLDVKSGTDSTSALRELALRH